MNMNMMNTISSWMMTKMYRRNNNTKENEIKNKAGNNQKGKMSLR